MSAKQLFRELEQKAVGYPEVVMALMSAECNAWDTCVDVGTPEAFETEQYWKWAYDSIRETSDFVENSAVRDWFARQGYKF